LRRLHDFETRLKSELSKEKPRWNTEVFLFKGSTLAGRLWFGTNRLASPAGGKIGGPLRVTKPEVPLSCIYPLGHVFSWKRSSLPRGGDSSTSGLVWGAFGLGA
jgi:hypothetical protein